MNTKVSPDHAQRLKSQWQGQPLRKLISFIEETYHIRAKELLSEIVAKVDRLLANVPAKADAAGKSLRHLKEMLQQDMQRHLSEEEESLFPHIMELEACAGSCKTKSCEIAHKGLVLKSVGRIHDEHDQVMDWLIQSKLLSTLASFPQGRCDVCSSLRENLQALFEDLREHTFLEDAVLLPRALELEKRFVGAGTAMKGGCHV